jgi:hypothetical protein
MSDKRIFWLGTLSLAAIAIGFLVLVFSYAAPKMFSGITQIGKISSYDTTTEVFDAKAGSRACLVFVTKWNSQPDARFFFSCNQSEGR